jgi:hypothetical protein
MFSLIQNKIASSLILFSVAFGVIALVPSQIFTMDRYITIIFFLAVFALALIFYFKKEFIVLTQKTNKQEFIFLFATSLLIHGALCYFILNFLNQPMWPFDNRGTSFLLMNNFFIWAKPLEVFVQQLLIALRVVKLYQYNMSLKKIITLFVFIFGTVHIFQVFKTDLIIGLGFTFFALLASFIFPYMLLRVRNGYIYNFMIHLAAYDIAALLAWSIY